MKLPEPITEELHQAIEGGLRYFGKELFRQVPVLKAENATKEDYSGTVVGVIESRFILILKASGRLVSALVDDYAKILAATEEGAVPGQVAKQLLDTLPQVFLH